MRPFSVSESGRNLRNAYPSYAVTKEFLSRAFGEEVDGFARLWLTEGIPSAFQEAPMLYEIVRQWLAIRANVHPKFVTMIGSARLGYSITPTKFGAEFTQRSDLDFVIVSKELLAKLSDEFATWSGDFTAAKISPRNPKEREHWGENLRVVPTTLARRFIDLNKIPTFTKYRVAQALQHAQWILTEKLRVTVGGPVVRKSTVRIYGDWGAFQNQLRRSLHGVAVPHVSPSTDSQQNF
jgi:hypothetical protein